MLPDFLESSYKRYKAHTTVFTTWLAETAARCGFVSSHRSTNPVHPPSTRLKGKARKEAQAAANSTKASSSKQTATHGIPSLKYIVPIADLTAQAQTIVNSTRPKIQVPQHIIDAAERAIATRRRFTSWFRKSADKVGVQEADNKKHSHFANVLEDILKALEPCFPPATPQSEALAESKDEISWANRFELLAVDQMPITEPSTECARPETTSELPHSAKVVYEIDTSEEDSVEERIFATYCLFEDLKQLRQFLTELWTDYHSGKVDLMTASVTTNTAFDLVRRSEEDFIRAYPKFNQYEEIMEPLYIFACLLRGEDPAFKQLPGDVANYAMADVAEWMYLPVYVLLSSFCDVISKGAVPVAKRGLFGLYNPHASRARMSFREAFKEDQIVLLEALPEFCLIQMFGLELPVVDELTRGLCEMSRTKQISLWLVFATQIFLDIHHIMREAVDQGLVQLRVIGSEAKSTLQSYWTVPKPAVAPDTWPKQNEMPIKQLSREIDQWILSDVFLEMKKKFKSPSLYNIANPEQSDEAYYLLSRHPLLCGTLAFKICLQIQEFGVILANAWGSVIYTAHLYNAVRQTGQLAIPWPDMDFIIDLHTPQRVFVGGAPTTPETFFKQASLMLGMSPETFAQARTPGRTARIVHSQKGPRGLEENSPVAHVLRKRYCADEPVELTMHNVEKLLNDKAQQEHGLLSRQLCRQWEKSHRLSQLQLLQTLRAALTHEIPRLQFNYVALHQRCIGLLRRLRENLHEDFVRYISPEYLDNESQLAFVVIYILQVAWGAARTSEQLGIRARVGSALLGRAGKILESLVEEQGDKEIKKLTVFCKSIAAEPPTLSEPVAN
ncbi:hypothetical protein MMC26_007268 [Xylographa opegraphella]|nr:hypothetical protein [Xylographa opegraphella]